MPVTVVVRTAAEGTGPSLTFDGHRIVIGRSSGCEVRLPDPSVSLRHASIRAQGAEFAIVDEGSLNGTWLDRTRLEPHTPRVIRSGELVRVGRVWLELVVDQTPATPDLGAKARDLAFALVRSAMAALGDDVTPKVRVSAGRDLGAELPLAEEGRLYLVGRGDACDLPLADDDASREHAGFVRRGSHVLVRDVGSKNGVYIGETPVAPERDGVWRAGSVVHVGGTVFELDDPVGTALMELEAAPDEKLPEGAGPPPPGRPKDPTPVALPSEPASAAPPPPPSEAKPAPVVKRRSWTGADLSVVLLAVVVIGVSVAGLVWVLR